MSLKYTTKKLHFSAIVASLVSLLMASSSFAAPGPKEVIDGRYKEFIQLVETKTIKAGMPEEELFALMQTELDPIVDFPRIARKVMGKYSRQATPEQLDAFTVGFKKTLINTYSKGLEHIDKLKTVEIEDAVLDDKGKRAKVNSIIKLSTGEQYQVIYSLFLDNQQEWKVDNLVVEGINIGIVFRNQFAQYMEQHGSVELAITNWGK